MAIPTYEIGAVSGLVLFVQHKSSDTMEEYMANARVLNGDRLYCMPDISGNPSLLYGPGSVTYEVTKCEIGTSGDIETYEDAILDPRTYIDNYGYIHVGDSNIPTSEMDAANKFYRLTFITRYHYINPSTGDTIAVTRDDPDTIVPIRDSDAGIRAENYRAIPYSPLPSEQNL